MRKVCFPDDVEAFNFISLDDAVMVLITVGVLDVQNVEDLGGSLGRNLAEFSLTIVVGVEVILQLVSFGLVADLRQVVQTEINIEPTVFVWCQQPLSFQRHR